MFAINDDVLVGSSGIVVDVASNLFWGASHYLSRVLPCIDFICLASPRGAHQGAHVERARSRLVHGGIRRTSFIAGSIKFYEQSLLLIDAMLWC